MRNILTSILNIVTSIAIGLVIPKLFLETYGPSFHGCISTANNLSSYVLLLTAGLTSAAVQALYQPLSRQDNKKISSIYNAIDRSYSKISFFILLSFIVLSLIMPVVIGSEIDHLIIICIYLILGLQFFLDNILLRKFNAIVTADNRISVLNLLHTSTYVCQAILQIYILKIKLPIFVFLLIPVIVVLVKYVYIRSYVAKNYSFIDETVLGENKYLQKRWNAFVHQISGLVLYNTDTLLLTIACNQIVVSVYVVYNMIFIYVYSFLTQICSSSLVAKIGRSFCTANFDVFKKSIHIYDCIYRVLMFTVFATITIVLLPFISLYTVNVDVEYSNVSYAILFICANMLSAARVPAMTVVDAVGHYKETQSQAIIEAFINLSLSLVLVFEFGIVGVLIGTICSFLYRTFAMIYYLYFSILKESPKLPILRYVVNFLNIILLFYLSYTYCYLNITIWVEWMFLSIAAFLFSIVEILLLNYCIDKTNISESISSLAVRISNMKKTST